MIETIKTLLEKQKEVFAWQVISNEGESLQLYATNYEIESERQVARKSYTISLMTEKEDKEFMGESSVTLIPGQDIEKELKQAIVRAGFVNNKRYGLPMPTDENVVLDSNFIEDASETITKIKNDYEQIKEINGVKLSYYEVFVNRRNFQVLNSNGLEVGEELNDIFTEYVLLSGDEEHEIYHSVRSRSYDKLNLSEEISKTAEMVRNTGNTSLAPTGKYDVLFSGETLDSLFNYFARQSDAAGIFSGWSIFKEGVNVIDGEFGDRLTLDSDPTIPGMIGSTTFDGNGLKRKTVRLIEENKFNETTATQKYASYTGRKAVGSLGNLVVKSGEKTLEEITSDRAYLEVLQFSTFEPNHITGAFSGEIRFAKLFDAKGNVSYIKGGSVSGKMLDAFKRVWFSRELCERETYVGPKGVLIEGLSVAGE